MIGFKKKNYAEPEKLLASCLPWAFITDNSVVVQKDLLLQRSFTFRGPDLQSSSGFNLNALCMQFNNAVKRLESGWAVFLEAQRYEFNFYPVTAYTNKAACLVDRERMQQFGASGQHYDSSYYLTFTWIPENDPAGSLLYKKKILSGNITKHCAADIEHFVQTTDDLAGILSGGLRIKVLDEHETVSYLHTSVSRDWHKMTAPGNCLLDRVLADSRLKAGDMLKLGEYYIPIIAINDFPMSTYPGILDTLNYSNLEYRWCTRFISLSREEAHKALDNYSKMYFGNRKNWKQFLGESLNQTTGTDRCNPGAVTAEQDVNEAMVELSDGQAGYGYITTNLMVWDKNPVIALQKMNFAKKLVQQKGFSAKQETTNAFQAFSGMMPGNVYANVRRPLVSTGNLAHIVPLTAVWSGEQSNAFTKQITGVDVPHLICSTNTYTPFCLNLNNDDLGHTMVSGPPGSGKSVFLGLLAIQFLKYPGARVIIFDKDRSARQLTMAAGGKYFEPGTGRMAFQPLRDLASTPGFIFATGFIQLLLELQGMAVTPEVQKAVHTALNDMRDFPACRLTISTFIQSVQHRAVKDALLIYSLQGHLGSIFDAQCENDLEYPWLMFEMSELMQLGQRAVIPALSYLFHTIEKLFTGRFTLLVLDEAWLFLQHDYFRSKLREWLKTLRKKQVFVVFATQEVADCAGSEIMSTILQACHTKIYLADNEALTPAMAAIYSSFGLTGAEIATIAQMNKKQDYFFTSPAGNRLIRLDLGSVSLALLAGQDHNVLDRIEQEAAPGEYLERILASKNMQHILN